MKEIRQQSFEIKRKTPETKQNNAAIVIEIKNNKSNIAAIKRKQIERKPNNAAINKDKIKQGENIAAIIQKQNKIMQQ